jgi:hypothetical protein
MKMGRGLQKPPESVSVLEQPGALTRRFSDKKRNMSLKERWTGRLECMHAEENKIDDICHMQTLIETKKIYKSQTKHQLNSDRTIEFLTIKTSKQDRT